MTIYTSLPSVNHNKWSHENDCVFTREIVNSSKKYPPRLEVI